MIRTNIHVFLMGFVVLWMVGICVPLFGQTVNEKSWPEGSHLLDRIVAFVGDEIVTLHEVEEAAGLHQGLEPPPADKNVREMRKRALEVLIDELLILGEAKELSLSVTDEEVEQHLEKTKRSNRWTDAQLEENVKRLGMTLEEYRGLTRKEILKGRVSAYRVAKRVSVTEADIQREIDANYDGGRFQDEVRISIILRGVPATASAEEAQESLRFARWLQQQAAAAPEHFADLARKHSEHSGSRMDGGDLGFFTRGILADPVLEEVAFSLPDGGVSGLIESSTGLLIVRVVERRKADVTDLESLKADVYERLYSAARLVAHKEWLRDLRGKSYVKILL